jgi:Ni/Co efflux regulator RcnB
MGCSSLQSETWHCRIFRKLAYMKKLLAVLIAGSFAAGAFAQAAAPRSLPPLLPQPQPPHRKHMKAKPAKKHHMQHSSKRCTSQPRAESRPNSTGTASLC